jgi:hypothetical protein
LCQLYNRRFIPSLSLSLSRSILSLSSIFFPFDITKKNKKLTIFIFSYYKDTFILKYSRVWLFKGGVAWSPIRNEPRFIIIIIIKYFFGFIFFLFSNIYICKTKCVCKLNYLQLSSLFFFFSSPNITNKRNKQKINRRDIIYILRVVCVCVCVVCEFNFWWQIMLSAFVIWILHSFY